MKKEHDRLKKMKKKHKDCPFMSQKYTFPRLETKLARLLDKANEQNIDIKQFIIKNFENEVHQDEKNDLKQTIKRASHTLEYLLSKDKKQS